MADIPVDPQGIHAVSENILSPPNSLSSKRTRCGEIVCSGSSSLEERLAAVLALHSSEERESSAPTDENNLAAVGSQVLQMLRQVLKMQLEIQEDLKALKQAQRKAFNASARNGGDALTPIYNANGKLPDGWFPATVFQLRCADEQQAQYLLDFYQIPFRPKDYDSDKVDLHCVCREVIAQFLGIRGF